MTTAKKLLAFIMAVCIIASMAACGGTSATGGAYYPIGVALADIMTKALGTQATAEVTGGSLDNLQLINKGECDIGIVQGNNMMDAYEGTSSYKDGKYENIAALFGGLSKGYFQVVVLENSSIKSMGDLVGKKVIMGPAGNGAIAVANTIWGKYGFSTDDIQATYGCRRLYHSLYLPAESG